MQIIKKNARNLTERFIGSSFAQKSVMAAIALVISTSNVMAGSKGAAGFTKATQEVSSYQTPVSNLMKAIAAVIVLVGAFNVYFKMQNGDQDVKKTIMLTIGGCIAFIALSEALPLFFQYSLPDMTMNQEGYPVFKGLQKPLEFMGIRGRFLTLAAAAIGVSFVGFIGFSIALGKVAGFIAMMVMALVGLITIYIKQRGGLHNKKRARGIYIYRSLRKEQ